MPGVRLSGLDSALSTLSALPAASREAAREAVNLTAKRIASTARDRTSRAYNVDADVLSPYIYVKQAAETGPLASVTLKVRALPITVFKPQIRMQPVPVRIFGRTPPVTLLLPHTYVAIFRGQAPKLLPGFFPLRQRSSGALAAGEKVRKRVGSTASGRGVRRDGSVGNKMTGPRFVTFPRKYLAALLPELLREAGQDVKVTFSAAWRRNRVKGRTRLQGNDL